MKLLKNFLGSLSKKYQKYQTWLEQSMRPSDFIFDCVHLLYYKCHKINPNRRGSCIDSPDWIKIKQTNKQTKKQQ